MKIFASPTSANPCAPALKILLLLAAMLSAQSALAQAADAADATPRSEPEHVVGTNPYPFDTVDARIKEAPPIELPDSVSEKLALLTEEQITFLKSGDARRFAGDPEETVKHLEENTPEHVKAWVEAMQSVVSSRDYVEGRDQPNIALNVDSPRFNAWRMQRPRSMDPAREAGPISLGRYGTSGGPPTFGGFPLALTPEDLIAGEVDVAIVGAPLNMGSGWRDSGAQATTDMRVMGRALGGMDQYVQITPGSVLNIVDYGDIAMDNNSTERSMQHVREIVREIVEAGAIPVIIGGDHSLEYPNVAALADVHGKEKVSVIHFDSHYDAWWGDAHLINHGAPVYRLLNEGHVRGADSSGCATSACVITPWRKLSNVGGMRCWTGWLPRPAKKAARFTSLSTLMYLTPRMPSPPAHRYQVASPCVRLSPLSAACVQSPMSSVLTWLSYTRHLIPPTPPRSTVRILLKPV
jgi:hypothetical protein